jgi:hypothetical protein
MMHRQQPQTAPHGRFATVRGHVIVDDKTIDAMYP